VKYNGPLDVIRQTVRSQGVSGMWRGVGATVIYRSTFGVFAISELSYTSSPISTSSAGYFPSSRLSLLPIRSFGSLHLPNRSYFYPALTTLFCPYFRSFPRTYYPAFPSPLYLPLEPYCLSTSMHCQRIIYASPSLSSSISIRLPLSLCTCTNSLFQATNY
jgi:hypothetical protein